jgi:hypothetical protein
MVRGLAALSIFLANLLIGFLLLCPQLAAVDYFATGEGGLS